VILQGKTLQKGPKRLILEWIKKRRIMAKILMYCILSYDFMLLNSESRGNLEVTPSRLRNAARTPPHLPTSSNLLGHLRKYICHQKMASMLTIPAELLTRIFEACDDFRQVVALASVCKHTHAAWVTNPGTIIWSVGQTQICSFEDALMAVNIYS
jgi:hypothetical protein